MTLKLTVVPLRISDIAVGLRPEKARTDMLGSGGVWATILRPAVESLPE